MNGPTASPFGRERRPVARAGGLRPALVLAVAQLGFALSIAAWLGIPSGYRQVIFSTVDSRGYLALANWLSGGGADVNLRLFTLRPFMYPLFLSLRTIVGDVGIVALQLALNGVSTGLVFVAARKLSGSSRGAALATGLLATNLSFGLIAFHALTETLAIFLLSVHLVLLVRVHAAGRRSIWDELGAGLSLSLATCTKPAFLPYWLLVVAATLWSLARSAARPTLIRQGSDGSRRTVRTRTILLLALCGPVLGQLALTRAVTGKAVFSVAVRNAFEERVFPAVYGFAATRGFISYRDSRALKAREEYPTPSEELRFLAEHPSATIRAAKKLSWDMNWRSASSFTRSPESVVHEPATESRLTALSGTMNRLYSWLHLSFFPLTLLALAAPADGGPGRSVLLHLAVLNLSLLLGTAASYFQGDRLVLLAMPVWVILYPAVLARLRAWPGPWARSEVPVSASTGTQEGNHTQPSHETMTACTGASPLRGFGLSASTIA